jgi:hypothetical protein
MKNNNNKLHFYSAFHRISKHFKSKKTNKQYTMTGQPIEAKSLKAACWMERVSLWLERRELVRGW